MAEIHYLVEAIYPLDPPEKLGPWVVTESLYGFNAPSHTAARARLATYAAEHGEPLKVLFSPYITNPNQPFGHSRANQ